MGIRVFLMLIDLDGWGGRGCVERERERNVFYVRKVLVCIMYTC